MRRLLNLIEINASEVTNLPAVSEKVGKYLESAEISLVFVPGRELFNLNEIKPGADSIPPVDVG